MVKDSQLQVNSTASALDRFTIDFEYNKTLQEVRREVRQRTLKD